MKATPTTSPRLAAQLRIIEVAFDIQGHRFAVMKAYRHAALYLCVDIHNRALARRQRVATLGQRALLACSSTHNTVLERQHTALLEWITRT